MKNSEWNKMTCIFEFLSLKDFQLLEVILRNIVSGKVYQ